MYSKSKEVEYDKDDLDNTPINDRDSIFQIQLRSNVGGSTIEQDDYRDNSTNYMPNFPSPNLKQVDTARKLQL